jgi:hypothetical protein
MRAHPSQARTSTPADVFTIELFGETRKDDGYFWGNIVSRRTDKVGWRWGGSDWM